MLPLTSVMGGLATLVLGSALACGPAVTGGGQSEPADSPQQRKQEKEIEKALYRILREDGLIKTAKCPYEMYFKRVEGRKLIDMEFKRRDKTSKSYDVIARARQAELSVHLPTRQLLVHMRHCYITSINPEVTSGFVEDKVWPIDLRDCPVDFGK